MSRPLLEFSGVSKRFGRRTESRLRYAMADALRELRRLPPRDELREGEFWALRDVDLRVDAGEVVGVIGHNGAGKSTLMQLAAGVLMPTTGAVRAWTRDVCRVDQGGVVSPFETGRENVLMQLALHRVPHRETAAEIDAIATIADLHDRLDEVVGNYSTGMRGRLGFAIYARLRPDLLLIDEAIGGGDRRFRDRFRGFLEEFADGGGSMLFAMHDTNAITTLCDRVILLEEGRVVVSTDPSGAIDAYNELAAQKGVPPMPKPRHAHAAASKKASKVETSAATNAAAVASGGQDARGPLVTVAVVDESMVQPGGTVEIDVTLTSPVPIARGSLALLIGRGDLFPLARVDGPGGPFAAGVTRHRCTIAQLPFVEGRYEVRAVLRAPDARQPLGQSENVALRIGESSDATSRKDALVRLAATWAQPGAASESVSESVSEAASAAPSTALPQAEANAR